MCDPASIAILGAAVIGAGASAGTAVYSNNKQKKAEARRIEAEKELQKKQLQPKETIAKTAQTPSINNNDKKTISSLRIPVKKNTTTVNTTETRTGLNIPL